MRLDWRSFYLPLQDEDLFFREMTAKYLEPLPEDKKKLKQKFEELQELRNKVSFDLHEMFVKLFSDVSKCSQFHL